MSPEATSEGLSQAEARRRLAQYGYNELIEKQVNPKRTDYDPPRSDARATVAMAERMGIDIKMITGDQVAIAREIARQLDLGVNILDASLFDETKHTRAGQFADAIDGADGFAQVFPERKFHIVDALQQRGHIVGMTGDGVNDTRMRRPFWAERPATTLLAAVSGTQALATLIAVYGVFMSPIGWGWALLVWGYALAWLLANDRVKLTTHRMFDRRGAVMSAFNATRRNKSRQSFPFATSD